MTTLALQSRWTSSWENDNWLLHLNIFSLINITVDAASENYVYSRNQRGGDEREGGRDKKIDEKKKNKWRVSIQIYITGKKYVYVHGTCVHSEQLIFPAIISQKTLHL